jgi:hypothetical protein
MAYMRILSIIFSMSALSLTSFAQGIVNFANSPSTLVRYLTEHDKVGLISGTSSWYFALLIGSTANGPFGFTGVYATNSATAPGRFVNNGAQVPGWPAGTVLWYKVAGWHSSLGPTFNPNWFLSWPAGLLAVSQSASGMAGGAVGSTGGTGIPFPPLPLFSGTGISSGFTFAPVPDLRMWQLSGGVPFGFNIAGLGGIPVLIEASTNLAAQSWVTLQSSTLPNGGSMSFSDPGSMNYPSRFYRIRSPASP